MTTAQISIDPGLLDTGKAVLALSLKRLQDLYGPRDLEWTFIGFSFSDDGPHLHYPLGINEKYVGVQLFSGCAINHHQMFFQITHEAVHLLNPCSLTANMLEEGLATKYSYESGFNEGWYLALNKSNMNANYAEALSLVERLIEIDDLAIRKLRKIEPHLSSMTAELVQKVLPAVPSELAEALCEHRQMRPA